MTVGELVERLQKYPENGKVHLHSKYGEDVLFLLKEAGSDDVWLVTESDVDMYDELLHRLESGYTKDVVYKDMVNIGVTVAMVRKYIGDEVAIDLQKWISAQGGSVN